MSRVFFFLLLLINAFSFAVTAQNVDGHSEQTEKQNLSLLLPEQETVLRGIARGESTTWMAMTREQANRLHEQVEIYAQRYRDYHLPHGQSVDVVWTDRERSGVALYDGLGDGLIWTGQYLGSLALRYAVEPSEDLRQQILAILDKFDLLMHVSGRTGYLARYAGPADDPGYFPYYQQYGKGEDPDRPGLGNRAYQGAPPYEDYVWLGHSSRDAYDGFLFGMALTWKYVDDPEIQLRLEALTTCVADRMLRDSFWVFDGQGGITNPTPTFRLAYTRLFLSVLPEDYGGNNDRGFLSCDGSGLSLQAVKYQWIDLTYGCRLGALSLFGENARGKYAGSYFPANLTFITMASLCALETDEKDLAKLQRVLRNLYQKEVSDHLNAHFAAIYMLFTGDVEDNDARATLQGQLLDFPDDKWGRAVDLRNDPNVEQYDEDHTKYAQLTHERPVETFIWQRSPCKSHGGRDDNVEYPGLDLLLPYWMGRVAGVIPAPDTE